MNLCSAGRGDTCTIVQGAVQRQHADWAASLHALKDAAASGGALEDSIQAEAAAAVAGLALLAGQARGQLLDAILQPLLEVRRPCAILLNR